MKLLTIATVLLLLMTGAALAQETPGSSPTPTAQDYQTQLQEVGCKAERQAAAATIVTLQKQIEQLKQQLAEKANKPIK